MTVTALIQSYGRRIENLEAEIKELNTDKSEVYKEAKSSGLDTKVLKFAIKRSRDLVEKPGATEDADSLLEFYVQALLVKTPQETTVAHVSVAANGVSSVPSRTRTRETENIDPETGEITNQISEASCANTSESAEGDGVAHSPSATLNADLTVPDFLRRNKPYSPADYLAAG